jgi:alanine dehydrogenase
MATGLAADVTIVDRNTVVLDQLVNRFGSSIKTVYSTNHAVERLVAEADVVIGGVLIPGAAAPKLVTAEMLKTMQPGSVIVDVAIDQGGCFETSHATTHADPTYIVDDIVHYCVANMPGGVARTSTFALNNVTLAFAVALADKGYKQAMIDDAHLRMGLNVHFGKVTNEPVARDLGYDYVPPLDAMGA